ncbi:flagellar hook-length control protein FliK, partial [Tritonibacter sp. SIMBA_163]|uniref:flagellar hook-length control protein FliK n=1 Tax=Tritonibacter sp. SIMBA_163 TaxID=3080868 RepID=UPI003980222A
TSVSILAQHSATREALLADSARLRAMLAESGFADAEVSVDSGRADGGEGREGFAEGGRGDGGPDGGGEPGAGDGAGES